MTDIENIQAEEAPIEEAAVTQQEEMLPKSVVSKIVERERLKAVEKTKREFMEQMASQQQQQESPQQAPVMQQQQGVGLGGMTQMSPDDVEKLIAQHAPKALEQHVKNLKAQHMVESFAGKMKSAEMKYPGLQQELNQLNYEDPRMLRFIELANAMDNTGDIMKEVIDNPEKMDTLLNLSYSQPYVAQKKLASLSQSIKTNQEALAQDAQARDPMSSLKPSTNAGMDNGNMSVSDFRKMLRGR